MTPTGRTLVALRASGYLPAVVECWIPRTMTRRDLFGIGDVLAIRAGEPGCLLVQATTAAHVPDRLRKVQAAKSLRTWLAAGNRFEVWGWSKQGDRWEARRVELKSDALAGIPVDLKPRRKRRVDRGLFDAVAE